MSGDDIDLERAIYDPVYRRAVIERLNREVREEPSRGLTDAAGQALSHDPGDE